MAKLIDEKLCIMPRDCKLLFFLFKNKVASFSQIHRYFFNGKSKQACSNRLNKLHYYGLIEKRTVLTGNKCERIYVIAEHGIKVIDEFLDHVVDSKNYASDSIHHDLILTDITKKFESLSVVQEILTESQLQSCSAYIKDSSLLPFIDLRSDRVCVIRGKDDVSYAALEFERSLKENSRNKSKIDSYYNNYSVPAVFYICQTRSLMNALKRVDAERSKNEESKLYFSLLSDVQKSTRVITFNRHDGEQLTFK